LSRYGVPDDEMGAGFPFGHRDLGPQGDPDLDAWLPEAVAEAILDGRPIDGRVLRGPLAGEIRPLVEAVGALRGESAAAELRGHARAMAAFREVSGPDETAGLAHTRRLEVQRPRADRRTSRARHRAPGKTRPAGRPPAKRLALTTVGALALVVILGLVAYSGYLPRPFQRDARVATGGSAATRSPSVPPSHAVTGPGGLAGSGETPAASPTPSTAPTPTRTPSAAGQAAAKLCQDYFTDPVRDMGDFQKLSKAAGGPMNVLKYCLQYLEDGQMRWPPGIGGPPGSGRGNGGNSNTGNGTTPATGSGPDGTGTSPPQHAR
jgi:hypothetical protein